MIIGGLAAAAGFLPRAWRAAWASLTLAVVALTLALVGGGPASWIAVLAATLVARGALWRLASGKGQLGPGGLQFGALEVRLAAAWGLAALFLGIVVLLALVILLCAAYAAASTGKGFDPANVATWTPAIVGGGRLLLGSVAALCGLGVLFVAVRVSLTEAATVQRGRVQVLSSFALTRGREVSLTTANFVVATPAVGLAFWGATRGFSGVWAVVESLTIAGVWLPMSIGLMAYAYELSAGQT